MAALKYAYATGILAGQISVLLGPSDNPSKDIPVLDFVTATADGDGLEVVTLDVEGMVIAQWVSHSVAAARHFEWPMGFPLWSTSNSDQFATANPCTVTLSNNPSTTLTLLVGYHFEPPALRRSAGQ